MKLPEFFSQSTVGLFSVILFNNKQLRTPVSLGAGDAGESSISLGRDLCTCQTEATDT